MMPGFGVAYKGSLVPSAGTYNGSQGSAGSYNPSECHRRISPNFTQPENYRLEEKNRHIFAMILLLPYQNLKIIM